MVSVNETSATKKTLWLLQGASSQEGRAFGFVLDPCTSEENLRSREGPLMPAQSHSKYCLVLESPQDLKIYGGGFLFPMCLHRRNLSQLLTSTLTSLWRMKGWA